MTLVAPEVVGIAEGVPEVDVMLTVKQIEIVQTGIVAQFADAGRSRSQAKVPTNGVICLARTSLFDLRLRQGHRNPRDDEI